MEAVWKVIDFVNGIIWAQWVLYAVLAVGLLFTVWSFFGQYRALTHGTAVIRGKYDDKNDPGAINHFQALSAALSATVGLGNIGGVAVAVAIGGPGAVFWMWMVGVVGMALKMTEVTLSMMYRNTDSPDNPHGGPMWVVREGMSKWSPGLRPLGALIGGIFCVTLLISTLTGGNMFQAWSVADATQSNFGVPRIAVGIILCVMVGAVIIGGIKRIGAVAGRLVPFMCVIYLLAAIAVILMKIGDVPDVLMLIFKSAFNPEEAQGAFMGGTFGLALAWGMKRALFSSEAGQGSSPIAHSAAKTDEPVREGVVAGLEPFIDTIVVCTLTAIVILVSGAWNRGPEAHFDAPPVLVQDADQKWTVESTALPPKDPEVKEYATDWNAGDTLFIIVEAEANKDQGTNLKQITGKVERNTTTGDLQIAWGSVTVKDAEGNPVTPKVRDTGLFANYASASLTSHAFNRVIPGLGKWLVVGAAWLFAISTMISWSYY
ncbi:MAG: sodium:alanine symporter family protein, partial [Phycisphaerales bacterium]|nr:sodium:alanine symporter family protein [Phycisphaerales bacterium]